MTDVSHGTLSASFFLLETFPSEFLRGAFPSEPSRDTCLTILQIVAVRLFHFGALEEFDQDFAIQRKTQEF